MALAHRSAPRGVAANGYPAGLLNDPETFSRRRSGWRARDRRQEEAVVEEAEVVEVELCRRRPPYR